jgi:hypothetical protein
MHGQYGYETREGGYPDEVAQRVVGELAIDVRVGGVRGSGLYQ